ncbi:DNA helicase [Myroides sp. NP-2]|uniref:DEAD/DEAH box helicase n=1 Tax=Myroides sp. NP-2 TaxID=2759945 RepID=UPI0015FB00C4|nr:DEAD/DEAH box helicase [Myroides sp. NP-2]MBB1151470.1 DNA helicase [Myroides sp. NP-2]
MSEKAQLTALKNSTEFNSIFSKLLTNDLSLSESHKEYILLCSLLFFKVYDNDNRYKSYFRLGYYIILKYSLLFKDFKPLYDISMQIGFYPICKTILDRDLLNLDSITSFLSYKIINEKFINLREKYLETLEQNTASNHLLTSDVENLVYVAPTSFGKSSLIKDFIINNSYQKIGIIVPTKSLLVQNFNDIKELNLNYKLITHDEMYDGEEKFIGILTQERATRLLRKNISFDILFIDEAHNLFRYNKKNSRGILLTRLIEMNREIKNHKVIYLSPLIDLPINIQSNMNSTIESAVVKHNLKSEDIFLWENEEVFSYNRFTNEYILFSQSLSFFKYIVNNSLTKNFIYNFRPKSIEKLSNELFDFLPHYLIDKEIDQIVNTINNEVHEKFYASKFLRKGIVYIHGKIPNQIKEYLEFKFKTNAKLKYIIANKVILEGVNLPIETIFITSTNYLDGKDLVNLIGRVNRLNYVFQEQNLEKLNPKIHFVNREDFQGKYSMKNKIELLRNHSFKDKIENPLLNNYNIDDLTFSKTDYLTKEQVKEKRREKDQKLKDNTSFLIDNRNSKNQDINIKKYFIENSFEEIYDNFDFVIPQIILNIQNLNTLKWENFNLIQKITYIFINNLDNRIIDYEIERLKNTAAQNFYNYYLTTTQKRPLKQNIISTFQYLKTKAKTLDPFIFIGKSYGEVTRNTNAYNNKIYKDTVYVNLQGKSDEILINLSIVKVKIEEDFVSYKLNKLIVFLFDFELIDEDEYFNHVYGTTNRNLIKLVRLGLSTNIVHKLYNDEQISNLSLNSFGNLSANTEFYQYLQSQNDLFQFEIRKFL